ncbi:hypothetical protein SAMN05428950_102213 [Sphingomonas sp. OV641]|uniref:hypothetical protein n=1 Tax=unclassified Sphingomonas TaxID=196159 RepID=UPI00082AC6AC|nr:MULTISPECIES: hypothetical protein [unclassified Sphingomonas]SEJ60562.1 hypothetical protein SAMN05428950_102213 [Sphingomonas sp. OV641]
MKIMIALAVAGTAFATAAQADVRHGVYNDSNSHYLDYKTDLSEARRELRSDLARANDKADRVDAWSEYRREVADARHDFDKEMAERGVTVTRRPSVTVEPY